MTFAKSYLSETIEIIESLDVGAIEACVQELVHLRDRGGRLFILGVGGSAANASHAVNDYRKIAHIEAYAPTDNVSELTARINDVSWATSFMSWLDGSRFSERDALLIFSVNGGLPDTSPNIVLALQMAVEVNATVLGIVGKLGGATKDHATACIVIPPLCDERTTPHTEGLAMVVHHLIVSHPSLAT